MDVNKPITNPVLLETIQKMKLDRSQEPQFFKELFNAKFLCPAQINLKNSFQGEKRKLTVGEGTAISLLSISNNTGENFLMAFTDWTELGKWKKEKNQQTIIISLKEYKDIILKEGSQYEGVVINSYGENIVLNRELLKMLNSNNVKIQKGESVMIGVPKNYPTVMVEKLKRYFIETNIVDVAYLLWMVRGEEASYLLVVDSKRASQEVFPPIGELCKPYLNGALLDILPRNSELGKKVVENQIPFYQE